MTVNTGSSLVRRLALCILPVAAGAGAALLLLLAASGPAWARTANQPLGLGCGATIQACLDAASPGSTIFIPAGDYTESLTLSKAVSLTGERSSTTILHAPPNTRVLTVTGAAVDGSVVISGLTFAGGHAVGNNCPDGCGGAILITATAQPLLIDLTISNSVADLFGGGLYAAQDSTLVLSGSTVLSNTSKVPFGVNSGGGGLYNGGNLAIASSTISNNSAWYGGGVYNDGNLATTDSSVSNNGAGGDGGGLFNNGTLTITGGTIMSDTAYQGGGISSFGTLTLTSSTVNNNTGSGVYNLGNLSITGSTIGNNAGFKGGGLYNSGALTVTSSTLGGNTAYAGGGLYNDGGGLYSGGGGTVALTNSTITSNTATSSPPEGGGGINNYGAMRITSSTISNNTALGGGGLDNNGGLSISSSAIVNNTGTDYGGGGLNNDGYIEIISSTITGNQGLGVYSRGGGIFSAEPLTVISSTISNNTADAGGGLYNWHGTVAVTGTLISHNTATTGGGAYLHDYYGTDPRQFVNDLFAGNSASSQGDAVYVDLAGGPTAAILFSTIASPTQGSGAAIVVVSGTVGITDTIIASYTTGLSLTAGSLFQDYNLFYGNGTNTTGAVSGGAHSLTGDPAFVNPAGGDYHLGAGSLAIDAGTDAGVTTDFDGDPRPQGAGFDIGFDESPYTALADVGVTKSASASLPQPGQTLTYTLIYSNAGPQVAAGVRLTDIVPANLSAVTYTSSGAALTPVGLSQYAWQTANLAPGAGGIITVTGVLVSHTRGTVFTNTATITTTTADSNAANDTSAVSVTVANAPPVAADDAYTIAVNTSLTVTAPGVLANATDANNDPLTAVLAAGPLTGTLNLHADGSFTYTPPLGYSGVVTFTYRANDGLADSNTATVTITVTPVADVGLVKSASASPVAPGQLLTYTLVFSNAGPSLAAGVRLTDIVPANLTNLSVSSSGAAITATGGLTYAWQVADLAPGAGGVVTVTGVLSGGLHGTVFTNTATLTTTTADSNAANNTSAVSVTVANVAPVARDDAYTLLPNSTLTVTAPGVLQNDTDANSDPLTAVLAASPLTGSLGLHGDGAITFTPPLNFTGPVTFTYRASDGDLLSAAATVTLTVNQPPVAVAGTPQTVTVGLPVTLDGSSSSDPDNDLPLSYGWRQTGGLAVVLSSATISRPTFTAPGVPAVLTFSLTVTDAVGLASASATTTVTVTDQAITGLSAAGGSPRVLGSSTPFTATLGAGTNVTYAWGFGDGSLPASGALVSHTYGQPGAFQAVVTATNSVGAVTATTTVTVTDQSITGLNAAGGSPRALGSSTPFTATIGAGTNVTYAWGFGDGSLPAGGALVSHTYGQPGVFQAVVTATNSVGQVTATTTVTVDDIPVAADDTFTTSEDVPLHVLAPGVLGNDSDTFPGGLTAQLASGPVTGTLVLAPNGAITYTPPVEYSGPVTFTYRASDGLFSSPPAAVTITVQPVNDPPVIAGLTDVTTTVGAATGPLGFTVGDEETPAGALTVTAQSSNTSLAPLASIVFGGSSANRTVTITPTAGLTGTATITLTVSDGTAQASNAFTLTVVEANYKLYLPLVTKP